MMNYMTKFTSLNQSIVSALFGADLFILIIDMSRIAAAYHGVAA